jgi:hypothetical protein
MTSLLNVSDMWAASQASKLSKRKRILQNRAKDPSAKVKRWNKLRYQMTFDGAEIENEMPFLKSVRSCDEFDKSRQAASLGSIHSSGVLGLGAPLDDDDDVLYYDSDPEDARESTFKRLGPRGVWAEKKNKIQDDSAIGRKVSSSSVIPLYTRRSKKLNEDVILDIIENLKNQRLTLLWHPTQSRKDPNRPPVCVKVWIESGIYLGDGSFLLPKLTWLPIHEGNADSFLMNAGSQTPEGLDMLDVCRVRECNAIDRRKYPFAHIEKSFIIQTQNGITMFETRSKQDRNHIVNGLKLLIARLASLLMLRDLRAVDEFFGGKDSVPGEAPWWAKGDEGEKKDNDGMPPGIP